jgi:hypothetical protein
MTISPGLDGIACLVKERIHSSHDVPTFDDSVEGL